LPQLATQLFLSKYKPDVQLVQLDARVWQVAQGD
jgi:hypothetical protein